MVAVIRACQRFIPTRVGNSSPIIPQNKSVSVHPHACGELSYILINEFFRVGSSPRVWGTRSRSWGSNPETRFIPTRVGNSSKAFFITSLATVHPHACGELYSLRFCFPFENGSSPRVWGTPLPHHCNSLFCRFIPTRVGNS